MKSERDNLNMDIDIDLTNLDIDLSDIDIDSEVQQMDNGLQKDYQKVIDRQKAVIDEIYQEFVSSGIDIEKSVIEQTIELYQEKFKFTNEFLLDFYQSYFSK